MKIWLEDGGLKYISPIEDSYNERVINHLRENFFSDEPLNKSVDLTTKGKSHLQLEKQSLRTIQDRLSVMALDSVTDEPAGVLLSGLVRPGDYESELASLKQVDDQAYKKIFNFIYTSSLSLDLFNRYCVDEIFECRILSVDSSYRGRGIASKLMSFTVDLAKQNGYQVMKTDCTGVFSQRIAAGLGFIPILEIFYKDHMDEEGKRIFPTEPPHDSFQITIKKLSPGNCPAVNHTEN